MNQATFYNIGWLFHLNAKKNLKWYNDTSDAGLRGDLRSTILGLLALGVLVAGEGTVSESAPAVFCCLLFRGVAGDDLCGTSKEPVLIQRGNLVSLDFKWNKAHTNVSLKKKSVLDVEPLK